MTGRTSVAPPSSHLSRVSRLRAYPPAPAPLPVAPLLATVNTGARRHELTLALIGLDVAVHRRPARRAGGVVLEAIGVAALYPDAVAATVLYGYLPTGIGLAVGLLVAAAGLVLADRWQAEPLAVAVVAGAAALGPCSPGWTRCRWSVPAGAAAGCHPRCSCADRSFHDRRNNRLTRRKDHRRPTA